MQEFEVFSLSNGIRLINKQVLHTKVAHCGIFFDVGSRDEDEHESGIAHFWEHMAFKGTSKRRAFHIINRLESVGGEINAYTTKEKVCFHTSALDTHIPKSLELLRDISFDSVFPEKEIQKEKSVILEEMGMYLDAPEEAIQDDFEELMYAGHPLAHNILGYPETLKSFSQKDLIDFIAKNSNNENTVVSVVSNKSGKEIFKIFEKYFSSIPERKGHNPRKKFGIYIPKNKEVNKPISQAYRIMGTKAVSINDKDRLPLFMLVNLLGGPALNSKLNLALREKHGLVYGVDAQLNTYVDTGNLAISYSTEKKHLYKANEIIYRELDKLRNIPLGSRQLQMAKEQLMGQIAIGEENNINLMLVLGKSLLDMGGLETINDIFAQIRRTTAEDILNLAERFLDKDNFSSLTFIPEN